MFVISFFPKFGGRIKIIMENRQEHFIVLLLICQFFSKKIKICIVFKKYLYIPCKT